MSTRVRGVEEVVKGVGCGEGKVGIKFQVIDREVKCFFIKHSNIHSGKQTLSIIRKMI